MSDIVTAARNFIEEYLRSQKVTSDNIALEPLQGVEVERGCTHFLYSTKYMCYVCLQTWRLKRIVEGRL